MSQVLAKLGDIAEFVNGFAFKPSHWEEVGKRIIRIQNLTDSKKPYNMTSYSVPEKYKVVTGDILVSWSATLDVFEWQEDEALLNQHIFKVVPDYDLVDKFYFKHALKNAIESMLQFTRGSTMKHINRGDFLATKIPLPPLPEQKRIAAILDKADAIRRKRQQAIQLADDFLRAVFLDMFGDPVTNSKGWEVKKIEEVVTKVTDGVHAKPNYTDSGVPFISVKNITTGTLSFDNTKFISEDDHRKYSKRCNVEFEDILYTKVGATYGRPAIVNVTKEFSLYVSVALIKPDKSKINPYFLKEVLGSSALKRQADRAVKGAGVPDLHLIEIKQFLLPLPDIHTQESYVNKTRHIYETISKYNSSLQDLNSLFNSLSQKAFRGEL